MSQVEQNRENDQFWQLGLRQKLICPYCGLDARADYRILWNFAVDHLVPRTAPSYRDDPINLVLCCHSCNGAKSAFDPTDNGATRLTSETRDVLISKAREYIKSRPNRDRYYKALWEAVPKG